MSVVAYPGFDPVADEQVLLDHLTNRYGSGWRIDAFDAGSRTVSASRPATPPVINKPSRFEVVEPDTSRAAAQ